MNSGAAFPRNSNDPFCQPTESSDREEEVINFTSWQSQNGENEIVPRWTLLTLEEKQEQSKVIEKLESKLQKINKRKENIYKYSAPPAMTIENELLSDRETLDDPDETASQHSSEEEQQEGLPLLWKDKSLSKRNAPHKTEGDYYSVWRQWFNCCLK